jgi:hypothetical protein
MSHILRGILAVSALTSAFILNAQTAVSGPSVEEIVQKHLAAVGGDEAIGKIKSISMESTAQIMGTDAPGITTVLDGVGFKSETDFNGTKMVQCYTDKGGWLVNPMAGTPEPTLMPDDQYKVGKGQIYVGGPLYHYAAKGTRVELVGKDEKTFKLKVTTTEKVESTFVIDAATYLVQSTSTRGKMQDQDVDITTSFSDYRKTDTGYMLPYALVIDLGGQLQLHIAVKKIEINKAVDPAVFDMPKAAVASPGDKPA